MHKMSPAQRAIFLRDGNGRAETLTVSAKEGRSARVMVQEGWIEHVSFDTYRRTPYGRIVAGVDPLPAPAPRVKPLTPAMQRLTRALEVHGYVDPIRDGGTVGTIVALMDRGILREATPRWHPLGAGRHYPATTSERAYADAIEQAESDAIDAMEGDDTPEPLTTEGAEALAARTGFGPVPEGPYGALAAFADDAARSAPDDQCGCERNPLGHLRSEHPTALPAEESWKHPYAEQGGRCGTCGFGRTSDRHPAPAPVLADACCTFVEQGGITTHEDGCPRFWKLTPEEEAYRAAVREISAPAPTLADDVATLRAMIENGSACRPFSRTDALAILDRIAARAPQRATDGYGEIWQHSCGMVGYGPPNDTCPGNCGEVGTWRALYVEPDGAQ